MIPHNMKGQDLIRATDFNFLMVLGKGKLNFFLLTDRLGGKVIIPDFFCIFPMNFAMATLGLKEIAEFFWKMKRKTW